jgi:hypothetical protein
LLAGPIGRAFTRLRKSERDRCSDNGGRKKQRRELPRSVAPKFIFHFDSPPGERSTSPVAEYSMSLGGVWVSNSLKNQGKSLEVSPEEAYAAVHDGIRYSGMGAWKGMLTDQQMWQVANFVAGVHHLPPQLRPKPAH